METDWDEDATVVLILGVEFKSFLTITSALSGVVGIPGTVVFTWGEPILVSSNTGIGIKKIQQL